MFSGKIPLHSLIYWKLLFELLSDNQVQVCCLRKNTWRLAYISDKLVKAGLWLPNIFLSGLNNGTRFLNFQGRSKFFYDIETYPGEVVPAFQTFLRDLAQRPDTRSENCNVGSRAQNTSSTLNPTVWWLRQTLFTQLHRKLVWFIHQLESERTDLS